MKTLIVFCCIVAAALGFPSGQNHPVPVLQANVSGTQCNQNGRCREVWRLSRLIKNIVCPDGQTANLRGLRCDSDDSGVSVNNVIDAPIVCPDGQSPDKNGNCRDEFNIEAESEGTVQNVIDAPVVCPEGQKPDKNGKCREVWTLNNVDDKNVIDAPIVCPVGQQPDKNGKCRDVYNTLTAVDPKNVIDAPVVCPPNYKPDQNGKCREQFNLNQMEVNVVPGQ